MAKRPCLHPGCPVLVKSGRCEKHEAEHASRVAAEDIARRGTATARGVDSKWRSLRFRHIVAHPFCESCASGGIQTAGKVVDHIVPHRGDESLRTDPRNFQTLCYSCHSRKTKREGEGYRATVVTRMA